MDHPHRRGRSAPTRSRGSRALLGALALGALCGAAPLAAQEVPAEAPPDTASAPPPRGISARSAFLRAVALPGWGHASIGSYHRGAFYFVMEGASAWMLVKTRRRFSDVQARLLFQEDLLRRDLVAGGVTDEDEILERLEADAGLEDLRALREARRQQREDWTAVSIFLVLISGVDAYVSAHLQDFPVPLSLDAQPVGNGRMELSLGFSLPR